MLQLRYEERGASKVHPLRQGVTLIGRLPTSDLVLIDPSVSRQHASIRVVDSECWLTDAGSRFGTFLDEVEVREEVEVKPGADIRLGEVTLVLEQHMPEEALLTEGHQISEGPGTICLPVSVETAARGGDGHLLRLLAEVGRTLLGSQSLSDVLNRVVDMAFAAVPAERAFLMLRDSSEEALAARVLRHRDGTIPPNPTLSRQVVRRVMRERVALLAADAATDPGLGVTDSILRFRIRSFMCAPLWNRDEVVGVLYVDSPLSAQFTASDLDAFTALTNAAAVAIEQARLSAQLLEETKRRERLQRYHSPAVVSRILHMPESDGGLDAQERDVSVMFCDLVGFTTMCENIPPAHAAALLNTFLTRMTDVVFEHEGTLDKFLGDALLAVFGAPFEQAEHPRRAVEAALAMRKALVALNAAQDGPKLEMRIAINSGIALTGDIGSPRRREFTVLGDVVNTAARIEDLAGPGEIVISGATAAQLGTGFTLRSLGERQLRGRQSMLQLFAVED
ncbi:MAG: FHA domain-containing protein [Acidobacteria bacterium]|nr:FHA domain-containing protein [Acidobacteriota bacterium]